MQTKNRIAFFAAAFALVLGFQGGYADGQPSTFKAPCGNDCKCGCGEGKPCHCGNGGCPTTARPVQSCAPIRATRACAPVRACAPQACAPEYCAQPAWQGICIDNDAFFGDGVDPCNAVLDYAPPPSMLEHYADDSRLAYEYGLKGVWLPEDPVLFRPFIADPRQITYSVGWRFNDQAIQKNVIDVSFGDSLAVYRWYNRCPWGGELQIEIEGAVWACFEPTIDSAPLVNADYYVGFPLTYRVGQWSFKLRPYHISSHIGDEYLLNHPHFRRRNPSAEYLDFFISYDWTDDIRVYDGIGYILAQDESFKMKPWYFQAGLELRLRQAGFTDYRNQIYGQPFYAMNFFYRGDLKHHVNQTYVLGYEFGKLNGLQRRVRIWAEYHDGYSWEGQFCRKATNYFSLRASYGF